MAKLFWPGWNQLITDTNKMEENTRTIMAFSNTTHYLEQCKAQGLTFRNLDKVCSRFIFE
jgi:DNA-binding Xre family transcriptional regulator